MPKNSLELVFDFGRSETVGKQMRIRRADRCAQCEIDLAVGDEAVWFADDRVVRCLVCSVDTGAEPFTVDAAQPLDPDHDGELAEPTVAADLTADLAGGSAQHEYERRAARELARKQQRVDDDAEWRTTLRDQRPVLGRVVTALTPRPQIGPESQATTAWKVGADGERRVAEVLADVDGIEVLHDRLMPGSTANIDHLVVGASGVFVIDAKKYTGGIETRNVGGLFRTDERLYVNRRDRTKLVDGLERQIAAVSDALGDEFAGVDVHGVLCFVGCEWGWFPRTKRVRNVTVLWPLALAEHVTAPGTHSDRVTTIADVLRRQLRPARR